MQIVFISNFLTIHQEPLCNALYSMQGVGFKFISTEPLSDGRKAMGWNQKRTMPYEIRTYEEKTDKEFVNRLIENCDILILGLDNFKEPCFQNRMRKNVGITFMFSERLYKNGIWRVFSPRGLKNKWDIYFKFFNKKFFMLCASAYTAMDYSLTGSFIGRCYKWGYFPPLLQYNIKTLISNKKRSILWTGRLLDWKHPESALLIADKLQQSGEDYEMNIIGYGEMMSYMKEKLNEYNLEDNVHLLGAKSPDEVRRYMEQASIFIATSDYHEGWGAVINEAMNSGCAVVANSAMGAAPYLIKDGYNGMLYKNGKIEDAYIAVKMLLNNREKCNELGVNAYNTIANEWNAETAAKRLYALSKELMGDKKKSNLFSSGICSKAKIIHKGE